MKLTSDASDVVELESQFEPGDADLAIAVRVSRDGFVGEIRTWVRRHDWFAFAQALTVLDERLTGDASVASISPGELELTVKALDRQGHLGIEGLIGRREFDREIELRFSAFAFDPGQISPFAREARRISETLGASQPHRHDG